MYEPAAFARFSFSECERFLVHLPDGDARTRLRKADGSEMNSISWIVAHIAWQWVRLATRAHYAKNAPEQDRQFASLPKEDSAPYADLRRRVHRFRTNTTDLPTPPPLEEALNLLREARRVTEEWLSKADAALLNSTVAPSDASPVLAAETLEKNVVRNVLHSFTHSGEIIAIRQILGHPEVGFLQMHDLAWPAGPAGDETAVR